MAQAGGIFGTGDLKRSMRYYRNQLAKGMSPDSARKELADIRGQQIARKSAMGPEYSRLDMQRKLNQSNIAMNEAQMLDMRKRRKMLDRAYRDRQDDATMGGIGQMFTLGSKALPVISKGMQALGMPSLGSMGRNALSGIGNFAQDLGWRTGMYGDSMGPPMDFGGGGYSGFDFGGWDMPQQNFDLGYGDDWGGFDTGLNITDDYYGGMGPIDLGGGDFDYNYEPSFDFNSGGGGYDF